MAGDWIKMRTNLWTDPRVVRLMRATERDRASILGALFRLWSLADEHSEDGYLCGYTFEIIDREAGIPGFSEALHAVDWLREDVDGCGITVPRFNEHQGETAKRRAVDADRKRRTRASAKCPQSVREVSRAIPKGVQDAVSARDGECCRYCGWTPPKEDVPYGPEMGRILTYDHVIPWSRGGAHDVSNIVVACSACNQSKNGRTPEEAGLVLCPGPSRQKADKKRTKCGPEKRREEKRREKREDPPSNSSPKRFVSPTLEEVTAYCRERKNAVDPEAFVNFYTSKGWMVGKNKMRDWKACVRTWEKNQDARREQERIGRVEAPPGKYDQFND